MSILKKKDYKAKLEEEKAIYKDAVESLRISYDRRLFELECQLEREQEYNRMLQRKVDHHHCKSLEEFTLKELRKALK